ncbi:MAG: acyl carrier protein [Haloplasmataceae bacterium]|jgi:acyl carrier protein|nr:acyl carrier protein [Haloplasmataceae bacterium]
MVFEKVQAIIADKLSLDLEKIKLESSLSGDFGADSLDAVEIIMSVEDEFDVEVADDVLMNIKTVKDIVDYIEKVK